MLHALAVGFAGALQIHNVLFLILGVILGIVGGAMPGIAASTVIALLLPLTFGMPADTSLILLAASYVGAEYGGSISAIFINTPGTPGAIATTFDGYPLTRKGHPLKAMCASLVPGTMAGILATIVLVVAAGPLVDIALKFGAAEYFALGVFGLTIIASLSPGSIAKAAIATGLGLFVSTIGTDILVGYPRFTFGVGALLNGVELVPALIGLLALPEAFSMIEELGNPNLAPQHFSKEYPTWQEWKSLVPATIRGWLVGTLIGAMPGAGAAIASLVAYNEEKRASKHPEKFGTGVMEGIAAPDAANCATVAGALIPTLTLGIPGSSSTAVMLGALTLHGLVPGPDLFQNNPEVVYSLFASQFLADFAMLALGLIGLTWWINIVRIPKGITAPCIIAICFVGAYSVSGNIWDVVTVVVAGIIGYGMRKLGFPVAATVLALVLGNMVEGNFRRMLLLSHGDLLEIIHHPIAVGLLSFSVLSLGLPLYRSMRAKRRAA
jgi:putative tricarboxylic transport membrane protein